MIKMLSIALSMYAYIAYNKHVTNVLWRNIEVDKTEKLSIKYNIRMLCKLLTIIHKTHNISFMYFTSLISFNYHPLYCLLSLIIKIIISNNYLKKYLYMKHRYK